MVEKAQDLNYNSNNVMNNLHSLEKRYQWLQTCALESLDTDYIMQKQKIAS